MQLVGAAFEREICSVKSLMCTASELIERSSGTASCTSSRAFHDRVGHLLHLRREFGHVEQYDALGGLLHLVDGCYPSR